MNIKLASKINQRVKAASRVLGVGEAEMMNRAMLFYLDNLENSLAMRNEFDAWESLSDEAWSKIKG
ncbi:MAG: hypothetical protein HYT46_03130 [Candidatus Vogelbacteria bacterium]|nr:hypothetical protein [Candidatus Vogelbacteria bacterium]